MSWYKNGIWTNLKIWEHQIAFRELCCAINEREKLRGKGTYEDNWTQWYDIGVGSEPLTEWYTNQGLKSFPDVADFDGMGPLNGANSAYYLNIPLMRTAVLNLGRGETASINNTLIRGKFCKQNFSFWESDAEFIGEAGYGSSWVPTTGARVPIYDGSALLQLKNLLEHLRWVSWAPTYFTQETEGLRSVGTMQYKRSPIDIYNASLPYFGSPYTINPYEWGMGSGRFIMSQARTQCISEEAQNKEYSITPTTDIRTVFRQQETPWGSSYPMIIYEIDPETGERTTSDRLPTLPVVGVRSSYYCHDVPWPDGYTIWDVGGAQWLYNSTIKLPTKYIKGKLAKTLLWMGARSKDSKESFNVTVNGHTVSFPYQESYEGWTHYTYYDWLDLGTDWPIFSGEDNEELEFAYNGWSDPFYQFPLTGADVTSILLSMPMFRRPAEYGMDSWFYRWEPADTDTKKNQNTSLIFTDLAFDPDNEPLLEYLNPQVL